MVESADEETKGIEQAEADRIDGSGADTASGGTVAYIVAVAEEAGA